MCRVLNISRSTYYYEAKRKIKFADSITDDVIDIFKSSRNNYGTRKIKKDLFDNEIIASRRRIGQIMRENGLVSNYTIAQYKVQRTTVNNELVENKVNREFGNREILEVVVSDLTYVRVKGKWNYVCLIWDLYNREIIGYIAVSNKDALLVYQAFSTIKYYLNRIKIFHTD